MQASVTSHPSPEPDSPNDAAHEPQEQADQIHPNRILHPFHATVHFRILMDVHVPKDAEDSTPENEEYNVPGKQDSDRER